MAKQKKHGNPGFRFQYGHSTVSTLVFLFSYKATCTFRVPHTKVLNSLGGIGGFVVQYASRSERQRAEGYRLDPDGSDVCCGLMLLGSAVLEPSATAGRCN